MNQILAPNSSQLSSFDAHRVVQTPSDFNHQTRELTPAKDSFVVLESPTTTIQPGRRDPMFPFGYSSLDAQHSSQSVRLNQSQVSQTSTNGVIPPTGDHHIPSRESSLPPSPSDLWNDAHHENPAAGEQEAANMTLDEPEELMHEMWFKYVVHSRQGVDPARGPAVAKNRAPKIFSHTFKARKFAININNYSFSDLKQDLFAFSDQMGKSSEGNSFIFKAADSTNSVHYIAYIHSHDIYNKGAEMELTSNEDVKAFFKAVASQPKRTSGIDTLMEDPNKKKLEAEKMLSIGQHQLQARNINDNVETSNSDLAHTTPVDPVDTALAALMLKYSTANNNNSEGWRVYKHNDITKVMPMNFQLLRIWAEHMVKNPSKVTLEVPPEAEGFEWTDLKKPVAMQTPLSPGNGITEQPAKIVPGTISEAQGYDIAVDPYDLDRIRTYATMEEYMAFAGVRVEKHDEVAAILLDHDIDRFDAFLYPEETGLKDLIDMGINRGSAMRLMNCARRFYQYILSAEVNNPKEPFDSSMII
ncbi:uncharacterized protein MELLADRAFT_60018 [Melampsora larici-populina 98AG31]|uniref:Uncharacterized protein n=1 Tax=Melampsora larici-populina (strain 98AG31 / pathotype 3-4-7) TaxID=747676 RepID=F4R9P0_MELLP|nr:uncharacterized protein MELLADRAFT_60018 [Melampsora larici-populina 98AG31]EGG11115.1 hypothetical protein MELLADRAFT_60018 [Melampsora larici-populina 98AG31]